MLEEDEEGLGYFCPTTVHLCILSYKGVTVADKNNSAELKNNDHAQQIYLFDCYVFICTEVKRSY